jgi:hypothetical protein
MPWTQSGWLWPVNPIDSEEAASTVLSELRKVWYGYGALQTVLALFLWSSGSGSLASLADGMMCVLAGYSLPSTRSRVLAWSLFVYAFGCAALTVSAHFGASQGGRNVILAAIMIVVGFRGIQATRAYHRAVGSVTVPRNVAVVTALLVLTTGVVLVGSIVGLVGVQILRGGRPVSDDALGSVVMIALLLAIGGVHLLTRRRLPLTIRWSAGAVTAPGAAGAAPPKSTEKLDAGSPPAHAASGVQQAIPPMAGIPVPPPLAQTLTSERGSDLDPADVEGLVEAPKQNIAEKTSRQRD